MKTGATGNRSGQSTEVSTEWYETSDIGDPRLAEAWSVIAESADDNWFTNFHEWHQAHIESYQIETTSFRYLVLFADENPVAICPLSQGIKKCFGLKLRTVTIFFDHDMDINDFLISLNTPVCVIRELIIHLKSVFGNWDLLLLQNTPANGSICRDLAKSSLPRWVRVESHHSKYMHCLSPTDNALTANSSKYRKNLQRMTNRLESTGLLTNRIIRDEDQLESAYRDFLEVEAKGWKNSEGTAMILDLPLREFYRTLIRYLGARGSCAFNMLQLDGSTIAAQFGLITPNTWYMIKIGYDEAYKTMGPGSVLLAKTIEHFSKDADIQYISFITDSAWQNRWKPQACSIYNNFLFNTSFKGLLCFSLEMLKNQARRVKLILARLKDK